jgi:hypothetical protein
VSNAYKFLSVIRQLTMADRTKKEYSWVLVREDSNNVVYTLQWREGRVENAPIVGSVVLSDIETINYSSQDPLLVTIVLTNSIYALKNSGGRTHVAFTCNDSEEALNYYTTLQILMMGENE